MIKLQVFKIGFSPKEYIQKLVSMLKIQNGQIIIKIQNGKFVHLYLQPSFKPNELEETETEETKD